ncbi:HAD-IA family hydrolase [Motiliproteus sp. MSK22-1]|uniref:HAD-IA family hydrolase n=1 Tax=Motiliproteus sp. MSK22-1 TaxID=1897630 RepID=UPI000976E08C|nr:HAD-IA family hydrolase [Motiliproteus sp. MSK22-1]OMH32649.1 HAD family hydrolase [Motiliproteus sp. MSK22-1]
MFKLLIFDWDGTIIDSADRIISSMQKAAVELGLPRLPAEPIRNIIGLGLPEALMQLYPDIDQEGMVQMRERYSYYYIKADDTPTALFPGVEDGLIRLRDQGFRLAVATGKSRLGLDRVLAVTGLRDVFEFTRCADETRSKPDPLMLEEILACSGHHVSESVMIGDTEFDLEMATNAGMNSLGVSYGAHVVERLENHNPMAIFDHFSELESWLLSQTSEPAADKKAVIECTLAGNTNPDPVSN